MNILERTVQGGILILLIVLIRSVAGERMPRRYLSLLWTVAALRLVVPISVDSSLSIFNFLPTLNSRPQAWRFLAGDSPEVPGAVEAVGTADPVTNWPLLIWLAVALLLGVYFLYTHLRGQRVYRCSLPQDIGPEAEFIREQKLMRPVTLRRSDQIGAPLTYGVFRPIILLPKALESGEQAQFVLAHELAHIRRWDIVRKLVLLCALVLHWFNPLVWVMYILAGRDIELACDESVLQKLGVPRAAYARTLLDMEERRSRPGSLTVGFARQAARERVMAVMNWHPRSVWAENAAALLVAVVLLLFATGSVGVAAGTDTQALEPEQLIEWNAMLQRDIQPYVDAGYPLAVREDGCITYDGQAIWVFYDEGQPSTGLDSWTYSGPGDESNPAYQVIRSESGAITELRAISNWEVFWATGGLFRDDAMAPMYTALSLLAHLFH